MAVSWAEAGKGPQRPEGLQLPRGLLVSALEPKKRVKGFYSESGGKPSVTEETIWFTLQKREEAVGAEWEQGAGSHPGKPFLANRKHVIR